MQVCRPQVVQKSVCRSVTFWQIQTVQLIEQSLTFTKNIRITNIFILLICLKQMILALTLLF